MKTKYKIIFFSLFFQYINAQQGTLDSGFGNNGIENATKLDYTILNGYNRAIKKVVFNNIGTNIYLGTDNSTGISIGGNIWNKKTIVIDAVIDASNNLYSTGFTQKEDNNKAIYVTKLKYSNTNYISDDTFNYDSKVVFDTKEIDEEAVAIKLQSDNKIVILGYSGNKGIVIRYNTDGYLDRTFNQNGFYTFQIVQNTKPTSLEIQQDGKILIAGNCFNGNNLDFFITRLDTNGLIDTTFGTNGVVIKDVNNHDNTGNAMILANDGSIYVGGKSYTLGGDFGIENQYSYNFSVLKFNQTGNLVTSASNGILPGAFIKSLSFYQYTNPPTIVPDDEEIKCMAYDKVNERIYIYGYTNKKSYINGYNIITRKTGLWNFCISLDNNFTSQNSTPFQSPVNYTDFETEIISATIKPSDMILGAASTKVYAVVKFNNCTTGESTFVSVPSNSSNTFPSNCYNNSINLLLSKIEQTNNGYYGIVPASNTFSGLYKLNNNFEVDEEFGINGKIINVKDFKVDNSGNLICTMETPIFNNGTKILLAKFTSNGKVDYTFGSLGEIRTQNLMNTFGLNVTPENDYIVSSYRVNMPNPQIILQKIKNNGEIDQTYNPEALIDVNVFSSYPSLKNSDDIINDNLGNIYTVAFKEDAYNVQNQIINLVKLTPTGVLDATFGINGSVNIVPFFNLPSNKLGLTRLDNGKLLVYSNKRMAQFNTDGSIDLTFGTNGFIDIETILPDFIISKIIRNGNDYFIGGYRTNGGDNSTIIKINNLGTIQTSFANNGIYIDSDANYLNVSRSLRNMYFDGLNKIVFYGGDIHIKKIQ